MTTEVYSAPNTATMTELAIDLITPSALNPRKRFDEAALQELADSIREHGLIEPIVVREVLPALIDERRFRVRPIDERQYELVAGERRWRAAKLAGLATVPARVLRDVDDAAALRIMLVENLQRQDLDPIEEAEGYRALNRVVGLKQAEIAAAVKRSQPVIANRMRLLHLPEDVQEHIRSGKLSPAHGVALAKFKDFPALVSKLGAIALARKITSHDLEAQKGLPFGYEIAQAGLVAFIREAEFDTAVCQQCSFNAYRSDGTDAWSVKYCLKPAHFEELQAEARKAKREALHAKIEEAAARGAKIPKLDDLPAGSYEVLSWHPRPGACTKQCPCYSQALRNDSRDGDEILMPICTDPARLRKLKAAETREEHKDERRAYKESIERVERWVDQLDGFRDRELVLIVEQALSCCTRAAQIEAAFRHAGGLIDAKVYRGLRIRDKLVQLAALAPNDLIKLAVEAALRTDLADRYGNAGYTGLTPLFDWYMPGDAIMEEEVGHA